MTNGTHNARTAAALTPRPGVTSLPDQEPVTSKPRRRRRALPAPAICGVITGAIQAVSPLGFWRLEPKTVYALGLTLIAAAYIGSSVADGRWKVIAAESSVAGFFVVVAAVGVSGSAWLLVLGLAGHGLKDLCNTALNGSGTHAGGHRSAPRSTGSPPESSPPQY
jgi:hypothetical protein